MREARKKRPAGKLTFSPPGGKTPDRDAGLRKWAGPGEAGRRKPASAHLL